MERGKSPVKTPLNDRWTSPHDSAREVSREYTHTYLHRPTIMHHTQTHTHTHKHTVNKHHHEAVKVAERPEGRTWNWNGHAKLFSVISSANDNDSLRRAAGTPWMGNTLVAHGTSPASQQRRVQYWLSFWRLWPVFLSFALLCTVRRRSEAEEYSQERQNTRLCRSGLTWFCWSRISSNVSEHTDFYAAAVLSLPHCRVFLPFEVIWSHCSDGLKPKVKTVCNVNWWTYRLYMYRSSGPGLSCPKGHYQVFGCCR